MLTVGVALATHNAGLFLDEQLDSLARQYRLPDELLIYDDCSDDRTVDIVERFADAAPFPVRLVRATSRRGYGRAFLEAARRCRTDLVAFCDQDDIWRSEKLALCTAEFERQPNLALVVHSAELFGNTSGRHAGTFPAFRRRRVLGPATTPIMPRLPGFAMVASRRTVDPWEVVEQPGDSVFAWDHDDWTATIAAAVGAVSFLPNRLVLYRQHAQNVWGAPPSGPSGRVRASLGYRSEEEDVYRETAAWARDHVRLLEGLDGRLMTSPGEIEREGPLIRARMWARLADVNERRATLYAGCPSVRSRIAMLLAHAAVGDYGRRARGALGFYSLGRDALHSLDSLSRLERYLRA